MCNSSANWSYVPRHKAEIVHSSPFPNMTVIINLNLDIHCFPQPQLKMLHMFITSNEPDIKRKPQIYTNRLSGREAWILAHCTIMVVRKRKDLIHHHHHLLARAGDNLPMEVPPAAKITACKLHSANIQCKILGDRNSESLWTWKENDGCLFYSLVAIQKKDRLWIEVGVWVQVNCVWFLNLSHILFINM